MRLESWMVRLAALWMGCSERSVELSEAARRGRSIYMGVCFPCRNQDPALDGSLGPAMAGASRDLLEARVLRAEHPPGYEPVGSRAQPGVAMSLWVR